MQQSIHPWTTYQDVRNGTKVLRNWLEILQHDPIDYTLFSLAWDSFRGAFGEPGLAPPGVSVAGDNLPDSNGLTILIGTSIILNQPIKDQLFDLMDAHNVANHAMAFAKANGTLDLSPIRKLRQMLVSVIESLSVLAPSAVSKNQIGKSDGEGTESEVKGTSSGKLLSASELAAAIGQPVDRVETFLRRYRKNNHDCFMETVNRKQNEPQYLYYFDKVMEVLNAREWPKDEAA